MNEYKAKLAAVVDGTLSNEDWARYCANLLQELLSEQEAQKSSRPVQEQAR
jgi:alpha-D-ribose 1-methylphosphonate 5-triphosphate synthase subunit PhnG